LHALTAVSNYVACVFGAENGHVSLGSLTRDGLRLTEVRRFPNEPVQQKKEMHWNIPYLYEELMEALKTLGISEEPMDSLSCSSWGGDYMLFDEQGALMSPSYTYGDSRTEGLLNKVLSRMPAPMLFQETGIQEAPSNTLVQLMAESSRRLKGASHLLPIGDGFNCLLTGVPRVEMSLASATQLFNPVTNSWSMRLLEDFRFPPHMFPELVAGGTKLGPLREELESHTGLTGMQVVAGSSSKMAASITGLPIGDGETWAFLRPGLYTLLGTETSKPVLNESAHSQGYTNQVGCSGSVYLHKHAPGMWILDECQRFWREKDRDVETDYLTHLATSAPPFASLIDPMDPRFLVPGDMPLKIQAFCQETGQEIPRKPGPVYRCILESLALMYRRSLFQLEQLTGKPMTRICLFGSSANSLLAHFTANALQIPAVVFSADSAAIGNVLTQALAMGQIKTLKEGREVVRRSFKAHTILPHSTLWNAAYARFTKYSEEPATEHEAKAGN
jgi:rhamnulokinase